MLCSGTLHKVSFAIKQIKEQKKCSHVLISTSRTQHASVDDGKLFPRKKTAKNVSIVDAVDCVHMELIKAFADKKPLIAVVLFVNFPLQPSQLAHLNSIWKSIWSWHHHSISNLEYQSFFSGKKWLNDFRRFSLKGEKLAAAKNVNYLMAYLEDGAFSNI